MSSTSVLAALHLQELLEAGEMSGNFWTVKLFEPSSSTRSAM